MPPFLQEVPRERLPRHIAVIMDGNGRWAQQQGLPRIEGHRRGVQSVRRVTEECARLGIEQLTLFCFSSENWKRPSQELKFLMQLLEQYMIEERGEIMRRNMRVTVIGRRSGLPPDALTEMDRTVELSRANTGMRICLAINYGSRSEIVDAVRRIAGKVQAGRSIRIRSTKARSISIYILLACPSPICLSAPQVNGGSAIFCSGKSAMRKFGSPSSAGPTSTKTFYTKPFATTPPATAVSADCQSSYS